MTVLDEVIKEMDGEELDERLKTVFSALHDPIVIDGRERETLLFLINRTITEKNKALEKKKKKKKKIETKQKV